MEMDSTLVIQVMNKILNNNVITINTNSNFILTIKILTHEKLNCQNRTYLSEKKNQCTDYLTNYIFDHFFGPHYL